MIVHQLSVLTTSMIGTQRYTGIGFRSWAIWVDGEMSARNFSSLVEDRIIKRFLHSDGRFIMLVLIIFHRFQESLAVDNDTRPVCW